MTPAGAKSHRNLTGLMQTDPTEEDVIASTRDRGFTQAWDTVGAGAQTHVGESLTERSGRLCGEVEC